MNHPFAIDGVLAAVARTHDERDGYSRGHGERLALTSLAIGIALSLDSPSLVVLCRAGYLHDIGKVAIPDAILFKPGRLDAREWAIMRGHPALGEEICRPVRSFATVLPVIRHHHERWDGSGYPDGLRGKEIPLLARVVQIADIYDALTNPRPYKRAYSAQDAVQIIQEETARGWRDPEIVRLFIGLQKDRKLEECIRRPDHNLAALRRALLDLDNSLAELAPDAELSPVTKTR